MDENFYSDFINRIKSPSTNDPNIFSENVDESGPVEHIETIVDEEYPVGDSRSRSIQTRLIALLKKDSNIYGDFSNLDSSRDQSQSSTPGTSQSQDSGSTPSNQPDMVMPTGQIRQVPDNAPQWIKNVYSKYSDKLPPITAPANDLDRIARQMLFDEVILWIKYTLEDAGITVPHELRELRDVILPQ